MKVRDIMRARVTTVAESDSLRLAVQMMLWGGLRHLPVLRADEVVGLLSERDVVRHRLRVGDAAAREEPVSAAMSHPPHIVGPDEAADAAAARMAESRLGCLPVVESGRLLGIVTTTDLLAAYGRAAPRAIAVEGEVAELMTRDPQTVHPGDALMDAAARMAELGIRHLVVVAGHRRVVGILSDRDVRAVAGGLDEESTTLARTLTVERAMTPEPATIGASASLDAAIAYFVDWRIGALPVVDEHERLTGILSYVDVLRHLRTRG